MNTTNLTRNLAISESGFLFLPTTGETFTVNEIGRGILKLMQDGLDENRILDVLVEEYAVDRATAMRDLRDFTAQLRQYHLLTPED